MTELLEVDSLATIPGEKTKETTLWELMEKAPADVVAKVSALLQGLSRDDLARRLMEARVSRQRVSLWLINQEYTRRGVPPIFRELSLPDGVRIDEVDLFWYDLEWLSKRHRDHVPYYKRWKQIFVATKFPHRTALLIWNERGAVRWATTRGLSLSDEWQKELCVLKTGKHVAELQRLKKLQPFVLNMLRVGHIAKSQKSLTDEDKARLQRRIRTWICGCLANQSPQRTADLYTAMAGEPMTRQLAHKTMAKIERDVPGAFKPKLEHL